MVSCKAIAAMSRNRVIGRGGAIPWHLPEDFKWFKQTTMGHILVMGRKTFESIGRALPGRETYVLSRQNLSFPGARRIGSFEELVARAMSQDGSAGAPIVGSKAVATNLSPGETRDVKDREIFICGGAEVYHRTLPLCSDIYLTLVKREVEGDAFFPPFEDQFQLIRTIGDTPEFSILHYRRKTG